MPSAVDRRARRAPYVYSALDMTISTSFFSYVAIHKPIFRIYETLARYVVCLQL